MNRYLTCGRCIAVAEANNGSLENSIPVVYRPQHFVLDYFCSQCLTDTCPVLYALPRPQVVNNRPSTPPPQQYSQPPPLQRRRTPRTPPGTPPPLQGVGLGGGFSPSTHAPPGEPRRKTYVLEEDCSVCFEQDNAGHRMCLRCNGSCCNTCWFRMNMCPLCRYSKN
jgi:hypothetical protein